VLSNSTFAGKVGSFTGAMAAILTDPLVIATIPFGASTSAGILKMALIEGGFGALSGAMIQPFLYRYKKTLNSPYDVSDALLRIGAARVLALQHWPARSRQGSAVIPILQSTA
jgi:hypothetical protein